MDNPKSEWKTRKELIDTTLKKSGWDVNNNTRIREEIDTKQSDFKTGKYLTVDETLKNQEDSQYADYLLLDSHGKPLAIIEAKRTTKDPISGQKQAEDYADDIKAQTGNDVFIFLTNGIEIWFWNRPYTNLRAVKGFHSREALERIKFQNGFKKDFSDVPIKKEIIDRPYQIEAVKRVIEGLEKGKRKFLIVHATGTGKTRTAMSLVDVLLRSNVAQKILFLADRKALRDQAYNDGFKRFFPNESKTKVYSATLDKNVRLFASTIQTFMECYEEFSVGDFDVIISDESHRSIYNKWKDVFTYFDAIQIGLTATPAELIDRDTFRFFQCEGNVPTALYVYEQAVEDGYLAPFNLYKTQTHFQIAGIKSEDVPRSAVKELLEKGIDPEEISFEGTDIERKVAVIGTNEAIVKEFMENCIKDSTGTLPAKSIFFAITKQHAKRLWESFEKLYPQYKGKLARIIVSDDSRAQEILDEFKKESFPRIAISVDMMDTGVDVPEVCNLVFAKPVFSKIKFWQMIGRGTRINETCKHKEWLPNGKKEDFLIFDCWNVFDWFNVHPKGRESKPSEAVPSKIFLLRLKQLEHFQKIKDEKNIEALKKKLVDDVKSLPKDSISVKERLQDVELASSPKLWDRVGVDPVEFLRTRLAPLMKYKENVEPSEASFVQKCEQLGLAILNEDKKEIDRFSEDIGETLSYLPTTIRDVKEKEPIMDKVTSKSFWSRPTYEDSQMIIREFSSLMKYKRSEPRLSVVLDIDDAIETRSEMIEYGPGTAPQLDYVEDYRDKVEKKIRTLAENHPTIKKIKNNQMLTEEDLRKLEGTLNSPELYITEENLQKMYRQHKGTLIEFIKKVLGLYEFPDPEKNIEEAFKTFVIENNYFNADQVNFIRAVRTVFAKRHHIEYTDLFEAPFTTFGSKAPLGIFKENELRSVVDMCHKLEREFFQTKNG